MMMKMNKSLLVLCVCILSTSLFAQSTAKCGVSLGSKRSVKTNKQAPQFRATQIDKHYEPANRVLSVVAYIVTDCDSNITFDRPTLDSMLNQRLNVDFSNTGISFKFMRVDTVYNCKYYDLDYYPDPQGNGQDMGQEFKNTYHEPGVINFYIFGDLAKEGNASVLGFAGGSNEVHLDKDAISPSKYVISHEMGHFFGLYHTWEADQTAVERADGSNCSTAGDLICDTPADVDGSQYASAFVNCNYTGASFSHPDDGKLFPTVHNIMSYWSNDECACHFTPGQVQVMLKAYYEGLSAPYMQIPMRKELW